MRLMVNATGYGAGGAAVRARELYGALHGYGYELLFLVAEDTPDWVVPPHAQRRRLPVRAAQPFRRWRRLAIPEEGDLLLTDHYPGSFGSGSVPVLVTLHDTGGGPLRRFLIRRGLRRAAGVIAVSEAVRDAWRVAADVVPNGGRADAGPAPNTNRGRDQGEHLLFCDPGLAHKGAGTARETARRLGRPLREVGRGVRWLDREEMRRELAGAAAVLCPSRREGFGMVALEAMAAGRPLVVSDLPAHREVCGDAALYAAPGNARAWVEATARALRHKDVPAARERAQQFSWTAAAEKLDRAIRRRANS